MLSVLSSGALQGIESKPVQIEVNTGECGELRLVLAGLPDAAVKESQNRVFSALVNSGFATPTTRTTVNLAPGDMRKEGPLYDLPIALGILASSRQIRPQNLDAFLFAGELSLSGKVRPIKGALAMALLARKQKKIGILLPQESAQEAALVDGIHVYPVHSLDHAVRFLSGECAIDPLKSQNSTFFKIPVQDNVLDFSDVKGQYALRRAVEVAVAGGHNLLMIGPPGSGKSMVAKRIPSIMPKPSWDDFLEILSISSAAGITLAGDGCFFQRPFRSPHHTISDVGLLGGGSIPGPGEISLAHRGVLFMDELPEFKRSALEVLRQPLEEGEVTISRSAGKVTFPCAFMLVAAMNPCPCGYYGDKNRECRCNPTQIQRYRSRISGPLLDRIDIHIEAPALSIQEMRSERAGESSSSIRERIQNARKIQSDRFAGYSFSCNALMGHKQIRQHCAVDKEQSILLQQAMEQLSLSARAYDRVLKVARTVADLQGSTSIETRHLLEAIQYRSLDRNLFY